MPLDVHALAKHVVDVDKAVASVCEATKLRILDLIGCACAGYRIGSHRTLEGVLDAPGPTHIWFEGSTRTTSDALRVNAFMAHAAYMEDGSRTTGGHPSCVVTPTALTLADSMRDRLPRPTDLLAAISCGYDIFLRVGERAYPAIVDRGFQSTAVLAPLASAATSARLLGLDETATAHALAIAASQGGGLKAALRASATQPLQVALGCEAGRVAALLAAAGAQGADDILATGFFPAYAGGERDVTEPDRSRILDTYFKIHGGCRGNHAPLDAFLRLCQQHDVAPVAMQSVTVYTDRYTLAAQVERPETPGQAQFSIAFALAVAAVRGKSSVFAFDESALNDAEVRGLMKRIVVRHDPAFDSDYPAKRAARVVIVTSSAEHECHIDYPMGEPENPVTSSLLCRKFDELARPVLAGDTDRVRDYILDCERQLSLRPLLDALGCARPLVQLAISSAYDQSFPN